MATLHGVSRAEALPPCLDRVHPGDAVLLIEDGVYAALTRRAPAGAAQPAFYALQDHLALRGIASDRLDPAVTLIDYSGWVALTVEHERTVNWD